MLSRSIAVLILSAATFFNTPVFANTDSPDLPAAAMESAADPSVPPLAPSDPAAPVVLSGNGDVFGGGLGTPLLQEDFSLTRHGGDGYLDNLDGKYLKGMVKDTGRILSSPLGWKGADWLKVGMVFGVTASLYMVDKNVKDFSQSHQSSVGSGLASIGNAQGSPLFILPGLGATYLYGHFADDHKVRRTALLALESYAITGLLTEGLKELAQRHRPNSGDPYNTWDGPTMSTKNVSFSSGHTASAFSIATVVASEYKDSAWVPPVAYGLATLTGLSRIYSNEHWSSDVFFGAALGYFVTKGVLSFHKEEKPTFFGNRLSLMPKFGKALTGLEMNYKF